MEDDIIDDNAGLLLGEWENMPRRSRRVAGLDPIDSSAEAPHAEEENDVDGINMVHFESDDLKCHL